VLFNRSFRSSATGPCYQQLLREEQFFVSRLYDSLPAIIVSTLAT
jgi:hypothetical protein